ncbi:MAG: polyphenol oxidase family protein [Myxococcota bacterium]
MPRVRHAFMGRQGGTSPAPWNSLNVSYTVGDVASRVDENRARALHAFAARAEGPLFPEPLIRLETSREATDMGTREDEIPLYTAKQVHGTGLLVIESGMDPNSVRGREADAVATRARGVFVGVQTADCGPVLLAASDGSVVCAVHAGWRGAAAGIVQQTVRRLCERFEIEPGKLVAAVGPCIGPEAFEVRQDVLDAFAGQHRDCFARQGFEHWLFNLPRWLALTLNACGVTRVETLDVCTYGNPDMCFSYRRARHKGRSTGCQLSVIGIC